MTTEAQLESYLSALDKALGPIATSERAEIITEIKSHVLEAQKRDPERQLESVLSSLGEPEQVANRYLLERGLKPAKTSKRSVVKWLVIGGLGMAAICALFAFAVIWHFSPLISVDDGSNHVSLQGGSTSLQGGSTLNVNFSSGRFQLTTSSSKCELEIPKGVAVNVRGANGKIVIRKPEFDLGVNLINGDVGIEPSEAKKYRYDFKVVNGRVDSFESSNDTKAFNVRITMTNGKIAKI